MSKPLRVGVVGVGHLGQHHARILANHPDVELVGVADSRSEQALEIAARHGTRGFADFHDLLDKVDAVSIAVPTLLHRAVAVPFLERGIAAMIEKPLAPSTAEGRLLVDLARKHSAVLQVGHIERFNPAWKAIEGHPLRPKYITAERQGTYTFRSTDIGVVHDLMIHDIDLVLSLTDAEPVHVEALGIRVLSHSEDVANARITFADGLVANLTANRVSQQASRKMHIWSGEGYVSLDFAAKKGTLIRPSEQLRRGEMDLSGVDLTQMSQVRERLFGKILRVDPFEGEPSEPLALELADFVHSVRTRTTPKVTGEAGLRALALAELVLQSIKIHAWEGTNDGPIGPLEPPTPSPSAEPIAGLAGPHLRRFQGTQQKSNSAKSQEF